MSDCAICHDPTTRMFNPNNRPQECTCRYALHDDCYKEWLQSTNSVFNCVICRYKVDNYEHVNNPGPFVAMLYGLRFLMKYPQLFMFLCFFVITYYKLILFALVVYMAYIANTRFGLLEIRGGGLR